MDVLIFGLQLIAFTVIAVGIFFMEDLGLQIASIGMLAFFVLVFVEIRWGDR